MARHKSALKAARQSVKRAARNQTVKSKYRTVLKRVRTAIAAAKPGTDSKVLQPLINEAQKVLKQAATRRVIGQKTAARYISRLSSAAHKAANPPQAKA